MRIKTFKIDEHLEKELDKYLIKINKNKARKIAMFEVINEAISEYIKN